MTQLASSTPTSRDKGGSSNCFCVLLMLLWLLILKEMFVKCGFRDELKKWSSHLLDNLSNFLIRAPENLQLLKSPDHFFNLWSILLLLFRNLICLSLYELLKSLRMFETGSVTTAGDEAWSTTAYINIIMYVNEMFPFLHLLICRWTFRSLGHSSW